MNREWDLQVTYQIKGEHMNEPEYDKYRDVEMWYICPTCNKTFEVDEPDNYCEHYKEDDDE